MRIRRIVPLVVLPLVLLACGGGDAAPKEKPLNDEQLVLMSTVFNNNYIDKGAEFELTTVTAPGGTTITMNGQVDFVHLEGYATVTGGAVPHPVTHVLWGKDVVLERRPSAAGILQKQAGRRIEFVARPVDLEHRRLDAILATVIGMSTKSPENVQILRQKEGSAFLRDDTLRGTPVVVMRYGTRVILWVDPVTQRLLRFEGNSAAGNMPIIVDLVKRVVPRIPTPKKEYVANYDELGGTFLQVAPTSP